MGQGRFGGPQDRGDHLQFLIDLLQQFPHPVGLELAVPVGFQQPFQTAVWAWRIFSFIPINCFSSARSSF